MGDPVTSTLILGAGKSIVGGIAGFGQAKAAKQDAEINSYIGRTRAMQTDTDARAGLNSELADLRATLAANGQGQNVGTMDLFNELRRVRGRERDIAYGNEMQSSRDYKRQARNAKAQGTASLISGFVGAAPSMFDLAEYRKKKA